jgi:DNA-binding transcriptional LysR family regulator
MDIDDLKKFLVVAKESNLQSASRELHVTAGALSKVVKRLETELGTPLFDRIGRSIVLNQRGLKFRQYALHLVNEAEQVISEFSGQNQTTTVRLCGPSILLQHHLSDIAKTVSGQPFEFTIEACWEGQALQRLTSGHTHIALVTKAGLNDNNQKNDLNHISLGTTGYQLVASASHSIFNEFPSETVPIEAIQKYGFACPSVSPFCGIRRGVGSDGWRDDKIQRRIKYRCDDFSVLLSLVKKGLALAYVPDFVAVSHGFESIAIEGWEQTNEEESVLVYKPSLAHGWLNTFAAHWQ